MQKNHFKVFILLVTSCFVTNSFGQNMNGGFYRNCKQENISRQNVEIKLVEFLNLKENHSVNLISEKKDKLGFTHLNYQQKFKNIPIEDCNILVHLKKNEVVSMNGRPAEFLEIPMIPKISSENSLMLAKQFMNVKQELLKQYPIKLVIVKKQKGNIPEYKLAYKVRIDALNPLVMCNVYIDAITGEVINKINLISHSDVSATANTLYSGTQTITTDKDSGTYRLRESGRNIQTFDGVNLDLDTINNVIINSPDIIDADNNWTSAPCLVSFTISAVAQGWWHTAIADGIPDFYIIVKDSSGKIVYDAIYIDNTLPPVTFQPKIFLTHPPYTVELWDYDAANGDDFGGSYPITTTIGAKTWTGNGNNGTYIVQTSNNPALDVHWGMEKVYDFYLNVFGQKSYDGLGSVIKNYVNGTMKLENNQNNAFAIPTPYNVMVYGMGDDSVFSPFVGLDVLGHEFSHMVIDNNGNGGLNYQGESGALNESFADILGTCIEFNTLGDSANWTVGENVVLVPPYYIRSLSDPKSDSLEGHQPDTYYGDYWADTTQSSGDEGGVHTNSGVQNYWFYLLSDGGSGINDIGNSYSVTAIGISKAMQIAYRNLTTYLTPTATYYDAYLGSLQSAEDLYGNPSTEYTAVSNAWYAVGIDANTHYYCQRATHLSANSDTFTDGSGSDNYSNNANCEWVINPFDASQIVLDFLSFDTELNNDTVLVYDGPDSFSPLLLKWSGKNLPPTITSSYNILCVQFKSNNTINKSGWQASYYSLVTGINEQLSMSSFGIYPNPNNGNFMLKSPVNTTYSVLIYNTLGEVVYSQKNSSSTLLDIDLTKQSTGIYFIQINSDSKFFSKKIIIDK
jgi:Zn-dependent metalloprotease